MGRVSELIRVLDHGEMELLHRSALQGLAEVGMRIEHETALEALAAAGCRVDFDRQVVQFPPEVVEHALARLRQGFSPRAAAQPQRYAKGVPMRYTAMYFTTQPRHIRPHFDVNTGGFTVFVYDLDGRRRPATLQDARDSIRLAGALQPARHAFALAGACTDELYIPTRPMEGNPPAGNSLTQWLDRVIAPTRREQGMAV